jgi:hypothetical protein
MKAEEATARSAPLRLAAKRSPPAFGGAGVIVGARWRRREAGAFGADPGDDLEMEIGIGFFLDFSCSNFVLVHLEGGVCGVGGRTEGQRREGRTSVTGAWRRRFEVEE